jgi:hypothetical protein
VPKYFFHIRWEDTLYVDHDGTELADVPTAMARAGRDAMMISRWKPSGAPARQWIEIGDAIGATLAIVQRGEKPIHSPPIQLRREIIMPLSSADVAGALH